MTNATADTIALPMPGEKFGQDTIVASCWQNDDGPTLTATVLILHPVADPEYYAVVEIQWTSAGWGRTEALGFPNIIPAAAEYEDRIGGY